MKLALLLAVAVTLACGNWVSAQELGQKQIKAKPAAAKLAVVKGRCVAAETGEPLANCKIAFTGRASNSRVMNKFGKPDWQDPEPVLTGADGTFVFRFVPPPPYQHHLDASCEGRVPRTARWGAFKPGQVDDLGNVEMQVGYILRGRVLDQKGKPAQRVGVAFTDLPLPMRKDAANDSRSGWCKADGTFEVSVPMPPGTWPIRISGRGVSLVGPATAKVVAQEEPNFVNVRVERMPSISGVVFDDTGRPVKRVYMQARPGADGWMTSAWTRDDGSFTIYKRDGSPDEVRLEVDDPGPCEIKVIAGVYEWGTHALRIELPRALSFELTVVEAGSDKPVESYMVKCYPVGRAGHSRFNSFRLGKTLHPNGVVTVDKVWRGKNTFQVVPRDPALRATEPVELDVSAKTIGPRRVVLQRMKAVEILIVDGRGKPVAASEVWVVDSNDAGLAGLRHGHFMDGRGSRTIFSSASLPNAVSGAKTNNLGIAKLHYGKPNDTLRVVVQRGREWLVCAKFELEAAVDGKIAVK